MWQILRSFPSSFSVSPFLCFSVSQSASQFQIDFSGRQQRQLIDLMSPPFFLWAYDCVIRLSHIDHATGWLNTTYSCTHTHEDKERLPHKSLKRAVGETGFRGANAIVRHAKFRLGFLWELWQDQLKTFIINHHDYTYIIYLSVSLYYIYYITKIMSGICIYNIN